MSTLYENMNIISNYLTEAVDNKNAFDELEKKYNIKIAPSIRSFINEFGDKNFDAYIKIGKDEYEVRGVFSTSSSKGYAGPLNKVIKSVLNDSSNKLIPVAVDSGSNYYCVDLKGSTVYVQNHEEDGFEKLCSFITFKNELKKAIK